MADMLNAQDPGPDAAMPEEVLSAEMVGARGFEPPAYGTQNRRATRLRHAPTGCF